MSVFGISWRCRLTHWADKKYDCKCLSHKLLSYFIYLFYQTHIIPPQLDISWFSDRWPCQSGLLAKQRHLLFKNVNLVMYKQKKNLTRLWLWTKESHKGLSRGRFRDHDYHNYHHFYIFFCWSVSPQYTTRLCRRERSASNTSKWLISVSSGPERMWEGSPFCFYKNTQSYSKSCVRKISRKRETGAKPYGHPQQRGRPLTATAETKALMRL